MAPSGTQSIDRAAAILLSVLDARRPVAFADLARELDLPKSTTSRILTSLERHGLVKRTSQGVIAGPVFGSFEIGCTHESALLLGETQESLRRVSRRTGEGVKLLGVRGQEVLEYAKIEALHAVRVAPALQTQLERQAMQTLHRACGPNVRPSWNWSPTQLGNHATIRTHVQSGYIAVEGPPGTASVVIAAPICTNDGTPKVALSVAARILRLGSEGVRRIGCLLAREAHGIQLSGSLHLEGLNLEDPLFRLEQP